MASLSVQRTTYILWWRSRETSVNHRVVRGANDSSSHQALRSGGPGRVTTQAHGPTSIADDGLPGAQSHLVKSDELLLQNRMAESSRELQRAAGSSGISEAERLRLRAEAAYRRILSGDLVDGGREAAQIVEASEAAGATVAGAVARIAWAHALYYRGELQEAAEIVRPVHSMGLALSEGDVRWRIDIDLAVLDIHSDRMHDAQSLLYSDEHAIQRAPDVWQLPRYYYAAAYRHFHIGDWTRATVEFRTGLNIARRLRMVWWANTARSWLAMILIRQDELHSAEEVLDLAEHDIQTARPNGAADYVMAAKALLAEASGDLGLAVELMREAARLIREWGTFIHYRQIGPDMVRLFMAQRHDNEARTIATALEDLATHSDVASVKAAALLSRGMVDSDAEALGLAIHHYASAGRTVDTARAREEAAATITRAGSRADGLELFQRALAEYERIGARRDAYRTRSRMRTLGFRSGPREKHAHSREGWGSLTTTEQNVARLLVEGLTNRRIAERLSISARTVEAHLEHISRKLGVAGRLAIALEAEKHRVTPIDRLTR
jgi:DNA-binding NarL/FixJ family response regulator